MADFKEIRIIISRLVSVIPRAFRFYGESPVLLVKWVFRVWQQEGISGVKRRMNVLLGRERDAVLYRDSVKLVLDRKRIDEEVEAIRESGLFDNAYYLAMYPDIQPQPQDPIRHYCESGWREGRNPSNDFDTCGYLEAYSDIKNAGLNPFWHYVVAGRAESRQATANFNNRYEDDVYFGQLPNDIRLIAYYANPDWDSVQLARKIAKGVNVQDLVPHADLGFYEISDPNVFAKQALICKRHGIAAWCFPLKIVPDFSSNEPLIVFLSKLDIQIGFVLDIDLRLIQIDEQLMAFMKAAIADKRYQRVNNRPVLIITLPVNEHYYDNVLTIFNICLEENRIHPYLIVRCDVVRCDGVLNSTLNSAEKFKIDAMLDFTSFSSSEKKEKFKSFYKDNVYSVPYSVVVSQAISRINKKNTFLCYQAIEMGHDDAPRKSNNPLRYTHYHHKEYRRWIDAAITDAKTNQSCDRRLLFINALNDWNQGAVLEPDLSTGYGKLNETSRALLGLPLGLSLPKVSVIVPNYNHALYLRRRLESVYRQTYKNIEVLLLDDCSDDQSRDILTEYAVHYPEITRELFNCQNSGGVFRQWAKGIKAATGDLIWIAESDDYCDENFLEKIVRCFDDEAVMLAYAKIQFVRDDETVIPNEFIHHVQDLDCREKWNSSYINTAHQEVLDALGIVNTIPNVSGVVFRRPVDMPLLEDEKWLSMRVAGDWIFYLHQLRGGKIAYSSETNNYFRRYENSTAAKTYKKEIFYKELMFVAQTVQSLYATPVSIVTKLLKTIRKYYDIHVGNGEEEFKLWCNEKEILTTRHTRMPNIAVSTMGFYPGGAEILPIRMANEFKRQGYSVTLLNVGFGQNEDRVRRMLRRDIPVVEISNIKTTQRIIHDFGIEVLNSHQWHVQKYPMQVPGVFRNLKAHVASLHGMIEYGDALGVTKEQLQVVNDNVTTWVYTADKNLNPFFDHGIDMTDSSRFIKLPNGMEPPEVKAISRIDLGIPEEAFVLCCVSRAIPDKGWAETIEATRKARQLTAKDIRLILVGNGPVYNEYCRTGVPDFVTLVGFSENSVGYYAAADMGIMLTWFRSESFPLTIIDCLFAGKPYIACDVGEIRGMLTEGNKIAGAVVSLNDWKIPVEQVAEIISIFVTDKNQYLEASKIVSTLVGRYHIDNVVKKYVEIFMNTLNMR